MPLLEAILKNSSIVGLLAPNFTPCASPDKFVAMYQEIVAVPLNQGPDVAVTLLTKVRFCKTDSLDVIFTNCC